MNLLDRVNRLHDSSCPESILLIPESKRLEIQIARLLNFAEQPFGRALLSVAHHLHPPRLVSLLLDGCKRLHHVLQISHRMLLISLRFSL